MNKQKKPDVSKEQAYAEIEAAFKGNYDGYFSDYLEYYAYPQTFGNTGGPFCKPGSVYGQAFCTFTIEAWVCGKFAVLFCNGKVVKVVDNWDGIGSVRM